MCLEVVDRSICQVYVEHAYHDQEFFTLIPEVRGLTVSAGGGHGGAVPLQAPAQAQSEVPGRLPVGRRHPEGHARLHCGCTHRPTALPGQHALIQS